MKQSPILNAEYGTVHLSTPVAPRVVQAFIQERFV